MWTQKSASDAYWRAEQSLQQGAYEEALRDFALLLRPDPDAYPFFRGFQCSYVILGAKRLARVYPQAIDIVDEWQRNNPGLCEGLER